MEITEYNKCTGCTACYSICPKQCINMKENQEGFLYPEVDEKKCISCGLCRKICPINRAVFKKVTEMPKTYLCKSKDECVRKSSASGGLFTQIAKDFLLAGNSVVYGCVYDNDFRVCHSAVEDVERISELSRSKYVQSDMGNIYKDVKQKLTEGKKVLFSGTSCQIYGLKSFLGKEYDLLYCIDVVCHGVPSPKVYSRYLKWMTEKNGDIEEVIIRKKVFYKKFYRSGYAIRFKDGKNYMKLTSEDPFALSFFRHLSIRRSCYQCRFKTLHRISDITIGDCWFSKNLSDLEDVDGVTLALVHSEKGRNLLNNKNIISFDVSAENAIKSNGGMIYSCASQNARRDDFFADIDSMDFEDVVQKYLKSNVSIKTKITNQLKNCNLIPQSMIDKKREKEYQRRIALLIPPESCGRMEL